MRPATTSASIAAQASRFWCVVVVRRRPRRRSMTNAAQADVERGVLLCAACARLHGALVADVIASTRLLLTSSPESLLAATLRSLVTLPTNWSPSDIEVPSASVALRRRPTHRYLSSDAQNDRQRARQPAF